MKKLLFLAIVFPLLYYSYYLLKVDHDYENYVLEKKKRRDLVHQRYSPSKVLLNNENGNIGKNSTDASKSYDVIIIGSGMAAMTCAAVLSGMFKKKVLVLEKHTVLGGGSHQYDLNGFTFDSGLHYAIPECQQLLHISAGTVAPPVIWEKLGEEDGTFDHILFPEGDIFNVKHNEAHLPELRKMFPSLQKEIDAYMFASEKVLKSFPLFLISKALPLQYQHIFSRYFLSTFREYAGKTSQEMIEELIPRKDAEANKLKAILCGLWIDTGAKLNESTFMLQASVFRGLAIQGGAYPRGGSQTLSESLVPVIEYNGGCCLTRAVVSEILTDPTGEKAIGVRMEDGIEIFAETIVSSAGYSRTYELIKDDQILKKNNIPRTLSPSLKPSNGFLMANIGINANPNDIGVTVANWWYHPVNKQNNYDIFKCCDDFFDAPNDFEFPCMITFPSMKDRDYILRNPKKISCQMLILTPYDWFEKWRDEPSGNRDEDYNAIKAKWGERSSSLLLKLFPKLKREDIGLIDVSTPLSIEYYLNSDRGSAVGLDQVPARFVNQSILDHLDFETPISGLYQTGQDQLLCGIPLVQLSGLLAALRVVGLSTALPTFIFNSIKTLIQSSIY